jgi:inner membrane protein involved in colicin E2 resistance
VINHNPTSANINIQFEVANSEASTNLLIVILAILGGVLFISLVIAAFFIIKRMNTGQQLIHPRLSSSVVLQQHQVQNNLSSI